LIELVADRFQSGQQTVRLDLLQDRTNLVRLLARLLDPTRLTEIDEHSFRAGRYERKPRADQHVPACGRRTWNVGDTRPAIAQVL
jgi:hypothetical protein